jgi:3-hydroxyisobutyrate dehydrogenase
MATVFEIGVAGLGAMGFGMAKSLLRSGFVVTGYDISPKAMERMQAAGGRTVSMVAELARAAEVFICMVATSAQASRLFFGPHSGALWHLPKSSIIILAITASPDFFRAFQDKVSVVGRTDIEVVDCPVSGGEARASTGNLTLLCSGDSECLSRLTPVLRTVASQIHTVPGALGAASRVKFVHQVFVGANIAAAVEVAALSQLAGLALRDIHDYIMDGDGASWLFSQRVQHILDPDSIPASSLSIITKDMVSLPMHVDTF